MNAKVTIIVPVYNTADYLQNCIDSINNINFNSYQVIFIDNYSNDGSYEILKKNQNNIKIFKADASKINQWKKKINIKGKKTIFFFWFLLHEISKNKKSIIIDYLKSIKKNFPNSTIVICELTKQNDIILQENCEKSLMPEYLLFHDFSGQGVLSFSDYK